MRTLHVLVLFCLSNCLLSAQAPVAPAPAAPASDTSVPTAAGDPVENSVVKVFATARYPDFYRPWTKQAPAEVSGSGVVIEGKRILTNAHVVSYATQLEVQPSQSGEKFSAKLEFIAPGMDLAILKLEDETFFETHPPLARAATLPDVRDSVMVYGFPTGGTSLSITKGIVSRIEFQSYGFLIGGLSIQIDAAINPGNSGGPAVVGEKMIGLAFRRLGGAENIGFIIPTEEIDLFLRDVADGTYDGKPRMLDGYQTFENPALRPFLKIPKGAEGVLISHLDNPDPNYPLRQWDLLTHIGTSAIDRQGRIKLGRNLSVGYAYQVQNLEKDGRVPITLVRDGQSMTVDLPVSRTRPTVIPQMENDYPPYFICGPMVFSLATQQFSGGYNNVPALRGLALRSSPLMERLLDRPAFPGEQLVVVASPFLPHDLSKGYGNPQSQIIKAINQVEVKNFAHLVELIRDSKEEYLVFSFQGLTGETLVFPRQKFIDSTDEILSDNGIRAQGTPELMAVWTKKK